MDYFNGIDVAYPEPIVKWDKVMKQGYGFVFIRASQAYWEDVRFKEHWKNAKTEGMPRGAYHVYDPRYNSPESQAEKFWSLVENDPGELPLVGDFEKYTGGSFHGSEYWYRFFDRMDFLSGGKEMLVYTARYYWNDNVLVPVAARDPYWFSRNYALFVANYTDALSPALPLYWKTWLFWQHSESTFIEGITDELGRLTHVDIDRFNGSKEEFYARFNLAQSPLPPEEIPVPPTFPEPVVDMMEYDGIAIAEPIIVRTYPEVNSSYATTHRVYTGNTMKGKTWAGNGYVWLKITSSTRNELVGKWVAVRAMNAMGMPKFIKLLVPSNTYVVKPDQQMVSWNYTVRDVAPAPAVNRTGEINDPSNFIRSTFTREWQFFWTDLLSMRVYGKLYHQLTDDMQKKEMKDLFTILGNKDLFLTNRFGTDNCNNYVTGDMRETDPLIDPLICAGSSVDILEMRTSSLGSTKGKLMGKVRTFKVTETPPLVTLSLLNYDKRIMRATVIEKDGRVIDFPQLYAKRLRFPWLTEYWIPYPLISCQDCWFPMEDLRKA